MNVNGSNCDNCKYTDLESCFKVVGTCLTFQKFEPKEETKVEEKLYTTGQMIDAIAENPRRIGFDSRQEAGDTRIIMGVDGVLRWQKRNEVFELTLNKTGCWDTLTHKKWGIIEPEPKKVSFVEAFKALANGYLIKSIVSNITYKQEPFVGGSTPMGNSADPEPFITFAHIEEISGEWVVLD